MGFASYVEEETVAEYSNDKSYMEFTVEDDDDDDTLYYDAETVYDEETVISRNKERSRQRSFMDFTFLDNNENDTVQVSYIEDDIHFVPLDEEAVRDDVRDHTSILLSPPLAAKPSSAPEEAFASVRGDQLETNVPVIFADNTTGWMEDDELTQITMDQDLLMNCGHNYAMNTTSRTPSRETKVSRRPNYAAEAAKSMYYPKLLPADDDEEDDTDESVVAAGSSTSSAKKKSCSSPSQKRIQRILCNDLYSCDVPTVRAAMEELRSIVLRDDDDGNGRRHLVQRGGTMVIMGTMEEYFEVEEVQYLCCVVLELLAAKEPEARNVLREMDGIPLIVRSMQDQKDSERVQEAGRAALATVCRR